MRSRRSQAALSPWIRLVFIVAILLSTVPAFADDDARANRLMVEAVGLIGAAEREPSAEERFRLLHRAHELLLEIVERHPSTTLAVKLATGQRIGTVSLAGVREALDEARAARAAAPPAAARRPGAPVHVWRHREAVLAVGWSANGARVSSVSRGRRRGDPRHRDGGRAAHVAPWRWHHRRRAVPGRAADVDDRRRTGWPR